MEDILESIGTPALLEQCAEEAVELAHACLKLARKLRGENPTPMTEAVAKSHLIEEAADVDLCLDAVIKAYPLPIANIESMRVEKEQRWKTRINNK